MADKVINSIRHYNPSGGNTTESTDYTFGANAKNIKLKKDSVFNNLQDELNFLESYVKHIGPNVVTSINGNIPDKNGNVASDLSMVYTESMLYGGPAFIDTEGNTHGWTRNNYNKDTDSGDVEVERYQTLLTNYTCNIYGYQVKKEVTLADETTAHFGDVITEEQYKALKASLGDTISSYVKDWGLCYEVDDEGTDFTSTALIADIDDEDNFLYFYWNVPQRLTPSISFDSNTGDITEVSLQRTRVGQQAIYDHILSVKNPETLTSIDSTDSSEQDIPNDVVLSNEIDTDDGGSASVTDSDWNDIPYITDTDVDENDDSIFKDYTEAELYDILSHFERMVAKYQQVLNEYRYYSQTILVPSVTNYSTPVVDVNGTYSSTTNTLCVYDEDKEERVELENNYSHGLLKSNSSYLKDIFDDWQKVSQGTCSSDDDTGYITFICYDYPVYDIPLKILLASDGEGQENNTSDDNIQGECFLIQRDFQESEQVQVQNTLVKPRTMNFGSFIAWRTAELTTEEKTNSYYDVFIPFTEDSDGTLIPADDSLFHKYFSETSDNGKYIYTLDKADIIIYKPTAGASTISDIKKTNTDANTYQYKYDSSLKVYVPIPVENASTVKGNIHIVELNDEKASLVSGEEILLTDFVTDAITFSSGLKVGSYSTDTYELQGILLSVPKEKYEYDQIIYDSTMVDTYLVYGNDESAQDGTNKWGSIQKDDTTSPDFTYPILDRRYHIVSSSCDFLRFLSYDSSTVDGVPSTIDWHLECTNSCYIYFIGSGSLDIFEVGGGGGGGGGSSQILKNKKYTYVKSTCGGGGGGGGGQCKTTTNIPIIDTAPAYSKDSDNMYHFAPDESISYNSGANLFKVEIGAGGSGGSVTTKSGGKDGSSGGTTIVTALQCYPTDAFEQTDAFSSSSKTGYLDKLFDSINSGVDTSASDYAPLGGDSSSNTTFFEVRNYNADNDGETATTYEALGGLGGTGKPNGTGFGTGASGLSIGSAGGNGSSYKSSRPSKGGIFGSNGNPSYKASKKSGSVISAALGKNQKQYSKIASLDTSEVDEYKEDYYPFKDSNYMWYFASGGAGGSTSGVTNYNAAAAAVGYTSIVPTTDTTADESDGDTVLDIANKNPIVQVNLQGGGGSSYCTSYNNSYEFKYQKIDINSKTNKVSQIYASEDEPTSFLGAIMADAAADGKLNATYTWKPKRKYLTSSDTIYETKKPASNVELSDDICFSVNKSGYICNATQVKAPGKSSGLTQILIKTYEKAKTYLIDTPMDLAGTGYQSKADAKANSGSGGAGGSIGFGGTSKKACIKNAKGKYQMSIALAEYEKRANSGQTGGRGGDGGSGVVIFRSSIES